MNLKRTETFHIVRSFVENSQNTKNDVHDLCIRPY